MCFTGRRFNCPSDPPQVTTSPWNTITLVATTAASAVSGTVTVGDLFNTLVQQLGFTVTTNLRMRIQRIRGWLPNNGSVGITGKPYGFSIQPYNFTTGAAITDLGDVNSRLNYASVGYEWSLADRTTVVFVTGNIVNKWAISETTSSGKLLFYYDLLWQFNTFSAPDRLEVEGPGLDYALDSREGHSLEEDSH